MELNNPYIYLTLPCMAGLFLWKRRLNGPICRLDKDLANKIIIITGATSGIGKETARALSKMNATLILACRNREKSLDLIKELKQESQNANIVHMDLDLASLKSINEFSKQYRAKYKNLDVLINNAGLIDFRSKVLSKDGFENQFAVNYLGHFYLTNLLAERLIKTPQSRVINVTCSSYTSGKIKWDDLMSNQNYSPYKAYSQSKLATVLFTQTLAQRLAGSKCKPILVHPGVVRSDIQRDMPKVWYLQTLKFIQAPFWYFFTRTPWQGAQGLIHATLQDYDKLEPGAYYTDFKKKELTKEALNEQEANKLWKKSMELLLEKRIVL